MKTALVTFALAAGSILAGCNDGNKQGNDIITLGDQKTAAPAVVSPCIIEVPCNEPELGDSKLVKPQKYYDFCDSTVTILVNGVYDYGPVYNVRSLTDLHGTEKKEMETAYAKYRQALGLK